MTIEPSRISGDDVVRVFLADENAPTPDEATARFARMARASSGLVDSIDHRDYVETLVADVERRTK